MIYVMPVHVYVIIFRGLAYIHAGKIFSIDPFV